MPKQAKCRHCGYQFIQRVDYPVQCTRCGKRWPLGEPKQKGA